MRRHLASIFRSAHMRLPSGPPLPTYLVGLQDFTWKEISGSDLNSAQSGFTLPAGSLPRGVVNYSGGVMAGDTMSLIGGGHSDYAGNECYTIDFTANAPVWTRRRNPTVTVSNNVDYYSDGRPTSRHTSWFQAYIAARGRHFLFGGANVWGDGNHATPKVDAFNLTANDYDAAGTYADGPSGWQSPNAPCASAKDSAENFWIQNTNGTLYKWTQTTATWTTVGSFTFYNYTAPMAHDPVRNRLLRVDGANSCYFDINSSVTETPVTFTGAQAAQAVKGSSLLWCADLGVFLLKRWNSQTIYQIHPTTFAVTTLAVAGPTPDADNLSGTYGRFNYCPTLKAVVYVPNWNTNCWIFKIGSSKSSDWIARSTAAGVVQAIRFPSATNVNAYKHNDAAVANVVFDSSDGIIGDGCLKINVPSTDGANSGAWRPPLNSSWTTDGQGFGSTPFYIQYRVKLGANRLTASVGGGGFKMSILSEYRFSSPNSAGSHSSNEIVLNNNVWRGIPFAYREHPISGTTGFDVTDGNGIHLQTAVDHGAGFADPNDRYCLYQAGAASVGCWFLQESVWFTVYMRVHIVDYGGTGTGNEIDVYVARDGDTSYTQLFNNRDFRIGSDGLLPNGVNGLWLLPYDTSRTSASYTTSHKYDQIIVSTSPIAVPL